MKRFTKILLEYSIIIVYAILAIFIEILAACITDGKFYIRDPRYLLTIIFLLSGILAVIKNQKARIIVSNILLIAQSLINIIFMTLYEMAGQWFDWSMLKLRSDAMGILENVPVNYWFTIFVIFISSAWLCFGLKYADFIKEKIGKIDNELNDSEKRKKITSSIKISTASLLIVLMIALNILTGYSINGSKTTDPYNDLLYSSTSSKYHEYGATANFVNEFYSGVTFYDEASVSEEEIENYIYSKVADESEMFGVSKGNNVVTILGETFEWMSFMGRDGVDFDSDFVLPNGLNISQDKMKEIYPNLWKMYDESYIMTNYHAREKTDISENYSILGNYPIKSYINYDYPVNVKTYSMPNMLSLAAEAKGQSFSAQYFHDGYEDFYNRRVSIRHLGFGNNVYFTEDMTSSSTIGIDSSKMTDYGKSGERNRDDQMIEACEKIMFPTNKQFYTYITTITTHGLYARERDNLDKEYRKLEQYLGIKIENASDEELVLYTYMAAAQVTDAAIGKIFTYLEENSLLDNTTIVLFGDHQGYYEGLSNYVKNIHSTSQCASDGIDYMNLYRVPMMIYDKKLVAKATNGGTNDSGRFNNKFSSSCDIVPTLLDLQGIKYYENMYYGHTVFGSTPTIVYSRGYGYWLDTYSYFLNINNFMWLNIDKLKKDNFVENIISYFEANGITYVKRASYSDEQLKEIYIQYIEAIGSELVENIRYIDQLYKKDLFKSTTANNKYINNMKTINNWN